MITLYADEYVYCKVMCMVGDKLFAQFATLENCMSADAATQNLEAWSRTESVPVFAVERLYSVLSTLVLGGGSLPSVTSTHLSTEDTFRWVPTYSHMCTRLVYPFSTSGDGVPLATPTLTTSAYNHF